MKSFDNLTHGYFRKANQYYFSSIYLSTMKFYLGVTDNNWYNFLARQKREDVNFWQPGGNVSFRLLLPGAPFLFKLKSPANAIGGIGFFSSHTFLPISMAWDIFEKGNGCSSLRELQNMIMPLRRNQSDINPQIGCIVLTNPISLKRRLDSCSR
ncbi:MAG: hypothetical protein WDO19_04800 [Bacteroidota bacterium]